MVAGLHPAGSRFLIKDTAGAPVGLDATAKRGGISSAAVAQSPDHRKTERSWRALQHIVVNEAEL